MSNSHLSIFCGNDDFHNGIPPASTGKIRPGPALDNKFGNSGERIHICSTLCVWKELQDEINSTYKS